MINNCKWINILKQLFREGKQSLKFKNKANFHQDFIINIPPICLKIWMFTPRRATPQYPYRREPGLTAGAITLRGTLELPSLCLPRRRDRLCQGDVLL